MDNFITFKFIINRTVFVFNTLFNYIYIYIYSLYYISNSK